MKIRNLDVILDEIGDFGRTKNDILDNIFHVSLTIINTTLLVWSYSSFPDRREKLLRLLQQIFHT